MISFDLRLSICILIYIRGFDIEILSIKMMSTLKLKKEHYDKKTKLEQMIDYYDCPVCFNMKEELVECPSCTSRACLPCVHDFSKGEYAKNPASKGQGFGKCMMCHKFLV